MHRLRVLPRKMVMNSRKPAVVVGFLSNIEQEEQRMGATVRLS